MTREDAEKGALERQERFLDRYEKMVADMREFIAASGLDAEELRKNKALSYLLYLAWRGGRKSQKDGGTYSPITLDFTLAELLDLAREGMLASPESVSRILRLLTSKTLEGEQIEELARQAFVAPKNIEEWGAPFVASDAEIRAEYPDMYTVARRRRERGGHQYDLGPREDR